MDKFMKKGAYMLLVACLSAGVVGCTDDDPNYNNVTPPVVAIAPNTLTGVITDMNGEPISGAKVSLSQGTDVSTTTDAKGVYLFDKVKAGTYQLKVEAEGKLPQETTLAVVDEKKSQNLVWNAVLAAEVKKEIPVSANLTSVGKIDTEALKDNDEAKVRVNAKIAAGTVSAEAGEDVKVIIAPIYSEGDVHNAVNRAATRASERPVLIGANLSCSKENVSLKKAIELSFELDEELASKVQARKYAITGWVEVESRVEGGRVIVMADEFTSYILFLDVEFAEEKNTTAISFEQSKWDNLYGAKEMLVGDAAYTYKVGTEINTKGTSKLTALLIEKLAQRFGATTVTTANGTYPMNVTLPIGTILNISGVQDVWNVSASALGKSVKGTRYGTVTVAVATSNRQHTGGSN